MEKINRGWLVNDWDNYDPKDDLSDIMTGRFLSALTELPQSLKQMSQEGDLRVQIEKFADRYQIVKIVKKREPEFMQGSETYHIYDKCGRRIPLTEQEYDRYLLVGNNPEDVYNSTEVVLESLDSQGVAPMDKWDLVFDATEYIRAASSFIQKWNDGIINKSEIPNPIAHIESLQDLIYSADWFPYSVDKKIHGARSKRIAKDIESGKIQHKRQLGAAIGNHEDVSKEDKRKLWTMWQSKKMQQDGEVQLQPWQFERAYRFKLQRQIVRKEITYKQAQDLLKAAMERLFSKSKPVNVGQEIILNFQEPEIPEWLQEATPLPAEEEDDYIFQHQDWLPQLFEIEEQDTTEDYEQSYFNSLLMDQ